MPGMSSKPFRVGAQPAHQNVNEPAKRPAPPPNQAAMDAQKNGKTLMDAGQELAIPAYDVGGDAPDVEGQHPEHRPAIPRPAAAGPARRPFKL